MTMPRAPYLTTRASTALSLAHDLADRLGHDDVTPLHVALGLVREGRNPAVGALHNLGVPLETLERELESELPAAATPRATSAERSWSPAAERMIEQARKAAVEMGTEYFGCGHFLLALLRDEASVPAEVLGRHGVQLAEARAELRRIYDAAS